MIPLRSRHRLREQGPNVLAMVVSLSRRIGYLALFLILLIAFVINFRPDTHLQGGQLGYTVFFLLLMATTLGVAAWSREVIFDKGQELVIFYSGFFHWSPLSKKHTLPLSAIERILLQEIFLAHHGKREVSPSGGVMGRLQEAIEQRRIFYKLTLDESGRLYSLEESSNRQDLESLGTGIASFLGIPYITESI